MPFVSSKQRRYLWAKRPELARKWTEKYGSKIVKEEKESLRMKALKVRASRYAKHKKNPRD